MVLVGENAKLTWKGSEMASSSARFRGTLVRLPLHLSEEARQRFFLDKKECVARMSKDTGRTFCGNEGYRSIGYVTLCARHFEEVVRELLGVINRHPEEWDPAYLSETWEPEKVEREPVESFGRYGKSPGLKSRRLHIVRRAWREADREGDEIAFGWWCGGGSGGTQAMTTDDLPEGYDLCPRCVTERELAQNRDFLRSQFGVLVPRPAEAQPGEVRVEAAT